MSEIKIDSLKSCNPAVMFTSTEENYAVEKSGEKPNTIRERTVEEVLNSKISIVSGELFVYRRKIRQIQITKEGTDETFVRVLTNVSVFKNTLIFSWRHYE